MNNQHYQAEMLALSKRQSAKYWANKALEVTQETVTAKSRKLDASYQLESDGDTIIIFKNPRTMTQGIEFTVAQAGNLITQRAHAAAVAGGWWHDLKTGEKLVPNIGEKLMLIVTEVSEAMEGARKDLMDDKLPHRKMIEVELADAVIRIGDLAGALNLDLGGAIEEKMAYNAQRADHKPENRLKEGGKKF